MVKKVLEKRIKNLKNFMCQCRNVAGARRKTHRWTPIRCFSAKMCQHGLSPGTSGVYLGNVRNYASLLGDKMDKEELVLLHRFQGIFERRYAEQKHDSGTAVAAAEANKVLKLLHRKGHYVAACALYLMGLTGLRMVDVHHLRVCDILFKPEGMRLKVRYGKTIKSTTKALPLEAKYRKCLIDKPACFGQFEAVVKNCMATGDINEKYFACVNAGNVGELLRGLRGEGVEVTTRCFRKHFAARAYAESGGDAIATSKALGHNNTRMGGAFYLGLDGDHVVEEYVRAYDYVIKG
jgi:hypothetical protein